MRGGCCPRQLQGERLGRDQTPQRGFGQEVAVPGLRCYPRGNVSIFCWLEARKEVHVLCKHFADVAELTAPVETEHDSLEDSILKYPSFSFYNISLRNGNRSLETRVDGSFLAIESITYSSTHHWFHRTCQPKALLAKHQSFGSAPTSREDLRTKKCLVNDLPRWIRSENKRLA